MYMLFIIYNIMNKEQCEQYIVDAIKRNKNVLELGKRTYLPEKNWGNEGTSDNKMYDLVIVNANGHMCENCYNKIKDNSKSIIINGECKLLRSVINLSNLWTLVFEVRGTMNISHFVHNIVINSAL
jgi:hypothetical protein